MVLRPVAVRTSFSAASTASVPVGPQNWIRLGGQRRRQQAEQVLDELVLHRSGQVEGVQRQLVGQNLADRLDHHWMVVPQRQGAGAGQAIDEGTPLDVLHQQPLAFFNASGIRRG